MPDSGYPSIASVDGSAKRNIPHLTPSLGRLINYTACTSPRPTVTVLEVASGTGEHVFAFAQEWPRTRFQPTERDVESLTLLQAQLDRQKSKENILPPRILDLLNPSNYPDANGEPIAFDGIAAFNVLHCSPPESTRGLFKLASNNLSPNGWVAIYGAFLREDGSYASEGDRNFDERFKKLHSSFGLRRLSDIKTVASEYGFNLAVEQAMPAGNWFFAFERASTTASIKYHSA